MRPSVAAILFVLLAPVCASAQSLYKYQGPDGEWIYADRPPADGRVAEVRSLGEPIRGDAVSVTTSSVGGSVQFEAENPLHAPVELTLRFSELHGLRYPDPDRDLTWVLAPRSRERILTLSRRYDGRVPEARYEFEYRLGDPAARHRPEQPYRVPFAIASHFPVTQAYPDVVTHTTEDSRYAIDIAMPVGTDVFAARGGTVITTRGDNYRSGLDPERDGPAANVVQILHDDGTFAVYAHLNWNTIRVRPGDRVVRGQYIADSGNTGFSSGPHLHFVVLRNAGSRTVSVPVRFQGAESTVVTPATGATLTAY